MEFAGGLARSFGLTAQIAPRAQGAEGAPWGWSADAVRQLREAGAQVLPDDAVERLRQLSHRRISREVMERLRAGLTFPLPPSPVECRSLAEVGQELRRHSRIYVKQPWSGSGRGVVAIDALTPRTSAQITGMIARQGCVMTEKALDGVADFAMLFHAADGRVRWEGYSLFYNAHAHAYGGNILLPDSEIERRLVGAGASSQHFGAIVEALERVLTELVAPYYTGWLGVDMLLCGDGVIAPCIEVNLRMTMGVVALELRRRLGDVYDGFTFTASRPARLPAGSVALTPEAFTLIAPGE